MNRTLLPALALTCNAFVWGLSWWPFRQLQQLGLHPLWATALTYFISLLCLLLWQPRALRGLVQHPQLWLLVLASGLTNVGFNWAVTVGDVVRVVLLFYMMPTWSVLLAWLLLGERPTTASLLRLALALAGVLVMLKSPETPWPIPRELPDWLALMGGFCFALTNIMLRRLRDTPETSRMVAMFGGGALMAAAVALAGSGSGLVQLPTAPSGLWLALVLGLTLSFLFGNLALQYGAARLRASTTALVMLSEIVFASVSSVALGAAELSWRTLIGGGLILLAAMLAAAAPSPET